MMQPNNEETKKKEGSNNRIDQNDLPGTTDSIVLLNGLVNKIWGIIEGMQADLQFIRDRYITPKKKAKTKTTREERKMLIKQKILTGGNKSK